MSMFALLAGLKDDDGESSGSDGVDIIDEHQPVAPVVVPIVAAPSIPVDDDEDDWNEGGKGSSRNRSRLLMKSSTPSASASANTNGNDTLSLASSSVFSMASTTSTSGGGDPLACPAFLRPFIAPQLRSSSATALRMSSGSITNPSSSSKSSPPLCDWTMVPREVLLEIFSMLRGIDLGAAECTCRAWRAVLVHWSDTAKLFISPSLLPTGSSSASASGPSASASAASAEPSLTASGDSFADEDAGWSAPSSGGRGRGGRAGLTSSQGRHASATGVIHTADLEKHINHPEVTRVRHAYRTLRSYMWRICCERAGFLQATSLSQSMGRADNGDENDSGSGSDDYSDDGGYLSCDDDESAAVPWLSDTVLLRRWFEAAHMPRPPPRPLRAESDEHLATYIAGKVVTTHPGGPFDFRTVYHAASIAHDSAPFPNTHPAAATRVCHNPRSKSFAAATFVRSWEVFPVLHDLRVRTLATAEGDRVLLWSRSMGGILCEMSRKDLSKMIPQNPIERFTYSFSVAAGSAAATTTADSDSAAESLPTSDSPATSQAETKKQSSAVSEPASLEIRGSKIAGVLWISLFIRHDDSIQAAFCRSEPAVPDLPELSSGGQAVGELRSQSNFFDCCFRVRAHAFANEIQRFLLDAGDVQRPQPGVATEATATYTGYKTTVFKPISSRQMREIRNLERKQHKVAVRRDRDGEEKDRTHTTSNDPAARDRRKTRRDAAYEFDRDLHGTW